MINLNYIDFKQAVSDRKMLIQYVAKASLGTNGGYLLLAFDGEMKFKCYLESDSDIADFENNYKGSANKPLSDHDDSGRVVTRLAMTEKGWRYLSHIVVIETATENGVSMNNFENAARCPFSITHLKADGSKVTDYVADQANIVETRVTIRPSYDYDVLKGGIYVKDFASQALEVSVGIGAFSNVNDDFITTPAGQKLYSEFLGGFDLTLAKGNIVIDGESSKLVKRVLPRVELAPGVPIPMNEIQIRMHHAAGYKFKFMCSLDYYRE